MSCLKRSSLKHNAYVTLSGIRVYLGEYGTPDAQERYNRETAAWLARGRVLPVEDWTVFWITAHFLNAAAQLLELGAFLFE
ncbi:MAG TPA: hypothetical protein PLC40_19290 [Candidatus Hydrogenedentes bacterium]|nr:MAG: hypothetical protein BWY09_03101 [Candidatus Hydrogenedentes bacterium ADurb.Bin179]HOH31831.1 hypothetical protein [Candidatus Hydrogenedentota bacterium]